MAKRGWFWGVIAASDGDGGQTRVRASAGDIYERVKHDATEELERPAAASEFPAARGVFFPIGFIVVIIGRAQLFTENTLYPVTLVLDERRHLLATARLWAIVLGANLLGAILFAVLATKSVRWTPTSLPNWLKTVTARCHAAGLRCSGALCWEAG